jgi:hypothetical protein
LINKGKIVNKIVIIGTQPPCPRCKLLFNAVSAKVMELKIEAEVKHLNNTDEEAKTFAKTIGLEAGTAKVVAKKIAMEINFEGISSLIRNDMLVENIEYKDYNNCDWSYELDEFLRPFENRAKEAGILMTPVLIINNEVKYQGSLPRIHKIDEWLLEFQKK